MIAGWVFDSLDTIRDYSQLILPFVVIGIVVLTLVAFAAQAIARQKWPRIIARVVDISAKYEKRGQNYAWYPELRVEFQFGGKTHDAKSAGGGFPSKEAALNKLAVLGVSLDAEVEVRVNPKKPERIWLPGLN